MNHRFEIRRIDYFYKKINILSVMVEYNILVFAITFTNNAHLLPASQIIGFVLLLKFL